MESDDFTQSLKEATIYFLTTFPPNGGLFFYVFIHVDEQMIFINNKSSYSLKKINQYEGNRPIQRRLKSKK